MCRTVEDAADLYRLIRGPDPRDPLTLGLPADDDPGREMERGVAGMRLARMPEGEREGVDADVLAAYDESLALLADLGASVVDIELPRRFVSMGDLVGRIIAAEGHTWVGEYVDDDTLPVDDDVRPRIRPGGAMSAGAYIRAQRERAAVKRTFDEALASVDALLTPATRTAAPVVAEIDQSTTAANITRPFNLIDWCALVVPNGRTAGGLPLSLQIACRASRRRPRFALGVRTSARPTGTPRSPPTSAASAHTSPTCVARPNIRSNVRARSFIRTIPLRFFGCGRRDAAVTGRTDRKSAARCRRRSRHWR